MAAFEKWLEEQLENAQKSAAETSRLASNSWGAGYDHGYADALQVIFSQLTASVAKSDAP